jgi:hypothetical protein
MADATFINAPEGANPEPNAYHMVYTDRNGKGGSEKVVPQPDPALNESLTEEQVCDEVKAMILRTRGDLYNRGVTADKVTITKIGPLTPSDRDRFTTAIATEASPAKVTRILPK